MNVTAQDRSGSNVGAVTNDAVMLDTRPGVYQDVGADARIRMQHRIGEHHQPISMFRGRCHIGSRMDDVEQLQSGGDDTIESGGSRCAAASRSDSNHRQRNAIGDQSAQTVIAAKHFDPVHSTAPECPVVVERANYVSQAERLDGLENDCGMCARTDTDNAFGFQRETASRSGRSTNLFTKSPRSRAVVITVRTIRSAA